MATDDLQTYKEELITLLHKSQDAFEKQLAFISAGALALSIGFIKDIIHDIGSATYRWSLHSGWTLLGLTLLINCISHIRAADLHNRTISEINSRQYVQSRVTKRYWEIGCVNWISVGTMVTGIGLIIFFVTKNLYNE